MNENEALKIVFLKIIDEHINSFEREDFNNLAPYIMLEELLSEKDIKSIKRNKIFAPLLKFIDHLFDAINHHFDNVTDYMTISEGMILLKEVRDIFRRGAIDIPEKIKNFMI